MILTLNEQKILVVGGSSGIGLAVAAQALKLGAYVIIASRNAPKKAELLREVIGDVVETHAVDVTSQNSIHHLFDAVGVFDHLVFCVRPESNSSLFKETDLNEAKRAFDTKFWGQYALIQAAESFIRKSGSMTLTSGIAGEKIYKGFSTTAMINSATETLCKSLAVELAPIRINVVSPGFVEPKPKKVQDYADTFPMGKLASLNDVAAAYLSIMANPYQTGTTTVIDGGARLI